MQEMVFNIFLFLFSCWIINISLNIFSHINVFKKNDTPLDFGLTFIDKQRILGDSTTVIGLFIALFVGCIIYTLQDDAITGLLLGFLVYSGHALGSFFKRRFKIPSGHFLPLIDHGDYVLLSSSIFFLLHKLNFTEMILCIILNYFIHPILCYIGYLLKLRKNPL